MPPLSHGAAAVIGAHGFLGKALSRALSAAGREVIPVTRRDPLLRADGALVDDLARASTVYWAASTINPLIAAEHPERVASDLADFARFCDAVHASPGVARVVLLSSGGTVYGTASKPPHDELTEPQPASAYGAAKLAMETQLLTHDVPSVVVRIANAYGPGQPAAPGQGVIGHWLRAVRTGARITVFGDLTTSRDYVYVDDVVDALTRAGDAPDVPPVINVGSGQPTTLAQLAEVIGTVVGRSLEIRLLPARDFDIPASWLAVDRAHRSLGWSAATALDEGVVRMWTWLRHEDHR